jgi:hypothetical protein
MEVYWQKISLIEFQLISQLNGGERRESSNTEAKQSVVISFLSGAPTSLIECNTGYPTIDIEQFSLRFVDKTNIISPILAPGCERDNETRLMSPKVPRSEHWGGSE